MNKTGIIILAAGNSSRLGTAKQLLQYQEKTLLAHIVQQAIASQPAVVIVVVGAEAEAVTATLADQNVTVCYNADWSTGLASSINKGLTQLIAENSSVTNCIFAVSDQPYLSEQNFTQLYTRYSETGKGIVASTYADTIGVPVLFTKTYFKSLLLLQGEQGAKKIVEQHLEDLVTIAFEQGAIDIDKPEDLIHLGRQMVSVSEAQAIIKKYATNSYTSHKSLIDAAGYVLAESIVSTLDIPAFKQSSMDGYAIRYEDRMDKLQIVGEMRAGRRSIATLKAGQAFRVFTGAPLPEGADTIVMQEKALRDGDRLKIEDDQLAIGMHVRQKGSEAQEGILALKPGHMLTPATIGFLAGIGCEEVLVFEGPKVAVIVTGDELQELGKPLAFGQVYESNSVQLLAALQQAGILQVQRYHSADDPKKLEAVLAEAMQDCDLILLVGGVSVGDYDFVVQSAVAQSVVPHFHKVKQKPGKPLFFGTKSGQMVFGLPGNPSSALTCFYLYVLPALDQIMKRPETIVMNTAITATDYYKNKGLTHFVKAYLNEGKVMPLHAQESYRLQSYAHANCLLVLDEKCEGAKAGEEVQVIVLP